MIWEGLRRVKLKIVVKKNSKVEREGFQRIMCKQCCLVCRRSHVAVLEVLNLEKANKENLRLEICLV